ncbi:hypothetical protein CDCA_CDCA16G4220 [Cyanidium caldarium]|uniref:CDP-diacylglycerol--glycerol-3-phosphate 3-phosphatidyltransferase n=1 Tax=Cyanidium caldarium TaxID=2771 RepID=A0AAV9J1J7_CYACA|nr:hypothetical protein CDCA_CDCA16G4220 [Cyanidium caldarium]
MNVATAITLSRAAASPWIAHCVLSGEWRWAVWAFAAASASDWLDGWWARRARQETAVGAALDPVADKVLVNTTACSLSYVGWMPPELAGLFLARDVLLVAGTGCAGWRAWRGQRAGRGQGLAAVSFSQLHVRPSALGKWNTFGQYGVVWYTMVSAALGGDAADPLLPPLHWLVGCTTALSGALYVRDALRSKSLLAALVVKRKE